MRRTVAAVAVLALAVPWVSPAGETPCAWPMFGRDPGRSFSQPQSCTTVSPTNVFSLLPAWGVLTSDNITASPTIVDGVLYVGSWDGTFYAIDAATGTTLWSFLIDDTNRVAFGRIVSTAAVDTIRVPGGGKVDVVLFGGGGTLYALAPGRTGPKVLAKINVDPREEALREEQAGDPPQIEIESSPVVGHFHSVDRILVGMDVHNRSGVGRTGLLAFRLRKSKVGSALPFEFELLYKHDPETATVLHSLTEGSGEGWGCGGVWSSPALDVTALRGHGIAVFGTSNCDNPDESAAAGETGEIGREAMIAIDATTGEQLWRFQPRPPNDVDDDFGSTPNMLPGGAVGLGGKDGWYYARDLVTGAERWSVRAGQHGRINTGFAVGGFIGVPAVGLGVVDPVSGAKRDLIFGATALPTPCAEPIDSGGIPIDTTLLGDPGRLFSVHAIDAATGEIVWRSPLAAPAYGHTTYANGVVFSSVTFGSRLQAFDAATGLPLWIMPTFGAPSSTPVPLG
ncbi:MAG: PQQ-binding-like beta-propeller repeat protein, partial [Actinomycetota bacterium]